MKYVYLARLACFLRSLLQRRIFRFITTAGLDLNKDGRKDIYEDPSQPVKKRVADLLKRMTFDEKIGQLWQIGYGNDPDKSIRGQNKTRRNKLV